MNIVVKNGKVLLGSHSPVEIVDPLVEIPVDADEKYFIMVDFDHYALFVVDTSQLVYQVADENGYIYLITNDHHRALVCAARNVLGNKRTVTIRG